MAAGAGRTLPALLGWALPLISWRGAFYELAGLRYWRTADLTTDKPAAAGETLSKQLRGVARCSQSNIRRYAPGGAHHRRFHGHAEPWAVPWLMSFNGLTRAAPSIC